MCLRHTRCQVEARALSRYCTRLAKMVCLFATVGRALCFRIFAAFGGGLYGNYR